MLSLYYYNTLDFHMYNNYVQFITEDNIFSVCHLTVSFLMT